MGRDGKGKEWSHGAPPLSSPLGPSGFGSQLRAGVPLLYPIQDTHHTQTLFATMCHQTQAAPWQGTLARGTGTVEVWGEGLEGLH